VGEDVERFAAFAGAVEACGDPARCVPDRAPGALWACAAATTAASLAESGAERGAP
jgi:hypothetical protein